MATLTLLLRATSFVQSLFCRYVSEERRCQGSGSNLGNIAFCSKQHKPLKYHRPGVYCYSYFQCKRWVTCMTSCRAWWLMSRWHTDHCLIMHKNNDCKCCVKRLWDFSLDPTHQGISKPYGVLEDTDRKMRGNISFETQALPVFQLRSPRTNM